MDETPAAAAPLALHDFEGSIGEEFEVALADGRLALRLEEASALPDSGRTGGSFRLEFSGPGDHLLPQASYPFILEGAEREIFIVPVSRQGDRYRYEALFL